jgi:hypothetical protein
VIQLDLKSNLIYLDVEPLIQQRKQRNNVKFNQKFVGEAEACDCLH